ncbi:MAG: hypothetical protein ABMA64_28855 [Myxococcota bacterium]
MPWPSSLFEVDDPSTPTGKRLALTDATLPGNDDGVPLRAEMFHRKDGFSTVGPVVTWFGDLDLTGLPSHLDLDRSLAPDARSILIDTVTHQKVPHWVELDETAADPEQRVTFLRPAVPLEFGHRYVVGFRGLTHPDGAPVERSDAFRALVEGEATRSADVESRREGFESLVFPELEAQGFARDELVLAWDFGTVSRESSLGPALWMRDDALARIGDSPPYTLDAVEEGDCGVSPIARTLRGRFTAPRYTGLDGPGTKLARDDSGAPTYAGDTEVAFTVQVPCSLAQDPGAGGQVVQYGHGLLGDLGEAESSYLQALANAHRWVLVAQNWTGMATEDAGYITLMLALDPSDFEILPDRTLQGFTEWVVGGRLAVGALASDPNLVFGGSPVIDRALPPQFYGNSQGAIFGGAYVALSPDIERGVLGVGGMPYSLLLSRSRDFDPFFLLLYEKYDDPREIALLLAAFQTVWDPGESGGYGYALGRDPLPGTPPKRVLLQIAEGDAQVTTLGGRMLARAAGAVTLSPTHRPMWGIPEVAGPVDSGSVVVEWTYTDGAVEPVGNVPPEGSGDTHECPRREPAAQAQLATFLATGVVEQTCDGACVSTRAGLCD